MSARSSLDFPSQFTQEVINNSAAAGSFTLVAGKAGKQTKVFRMKLIIGGATTLEILDETFPLDFLVFPSAGGTMILDFTSIDMPPWYETSPGNDLVISTSAGVQLSGNFDYLQS